MVAVAAEHELFKACQVIFGVELNVSRQFLEYVQMSGVKTAYRKRAKETHPDLLAGEGELAQARGARQFQSVKEAYEHLKLYVVEREKGFRFSVSQGYTAPRASTPPRPKPAGQSWQQGASQRAKWQQWQCRRDEAVRKQTAAAQAAAARVQAQQRRASQSRAQASKTTQLFQGSLPQRPMLFGHFLYYSGLVDWQTLVKALIWQRANRPRVGEIGQRFGWLSSGDVDTILQSKRGRKMFGEVAVERGKLSASQLRMLLASQKAQQKRIGEYFVRSRILNRRKLAELLHLFQAHNAKQNRFRRKAS